ncbi:glutathione S-transferase family protein [Methylobacter sp. YRD-M1]|uniref:glutathione S-transferase family protein n=1 Tax=Methylobacter sp. YRD-M1 TaxID=2911520 RepID=UPI00227BCCC6|nr:glutathione S-transferase family protein [Methylobacter sp. YRD-M1]WAK04035.1 glutathione S-transferase family protein [Methylobacter sp. YRD-M1]
MSMTLVIGNKNYSSWSLRPWLFLKHHGITFDEIKISLAQADSKNRILGFSPSGKVPVLIDGGLKVWDSLAIMEYLAERFPETQAWPQEQAERAFARSISAEMHAGFPALRTHCGMNCRRPPAARKLPEEVHNDIERIGQIWRQCRKQYWDRGPWLFGQFTIADAMFAPVALRFYLYQLDTNAEAYGYVNTVLEHPALKEWVEAGMRELEVIPAYED